ncbi:MAG: nucleotidyl transferase AbiEii/AbiGii toxin family protein [Candidatus Latescibacteria bacterium]|nr:nucleotidyl transferase AbiEii/AbiGii toxin family protein [Candidatus Latescibacterota bacterium]
MNTISYSPLQLRELFHLEILRLLARKLKPGHYVLKGGVNMRFFFGSPRYSEDMDLDAQDIGVADLQDKVMSVLSARSLLDSCAAFGVTRVVPPKISKAKQTETTQRFKIHLITSDGDDLFTKIEFSRRGIDPGVRIESIRAEILRTLRLPPLICPHYCAETAMQQKIGALAGRSATQARDIFDLYLLSTQAKVSKENVSIAKKEMLKKAMENIYSVDFKQFDDTVLSFFPHEQRMLYEEADRWDEIRLIVSHLIGALL